MERSRWKKWIKRILAGLFILGLVLLVATYLLLITHRKEIVEKITSTFNEKLSGKIKIKDVDFTIFDQFPSFTTRIEGVTITDSASAVRGDTLLRAEKISIGLDLPKLFLGSIQFNTIKISGATILMVKDRTARMNTPKPRIVTAASPTSDKSSSIPVMKRIFLQNVSFTMIDSVKNKRFGFKIIKTELKDCAGDAPVSYEMVGLIHFDGLVFNPLKGGYLTDQDVEIKTPIGFDPDKKLLTINDGVLTVKKQKLKIRISMNFGDKTMKMRFDTKSILPSVAYGILTPAISEKLSAIQLEKPIMARVNIIGSIAPGNKPAVDVYFKSVGNKLNIKDKSVDNLDVLGQFDNHIDSNKINDDHNTKVFLPRLNGSLNGIPLQSQMIVTDLIDPVLYAKAQLSYDERKQGEVTTERFKFLDGNIKINVLFNAPLTHNIDTVNNTVGGDISGEINIRDASFDYLATGYEFRNMNAHLSFKKPDLTIDSMYLSLNGSSLRITGSAVNFISFLFVPSIKASINLNVATGTVNLDSFKHTQVPTDQKKTTKATAKKKKPEKNSVATTIDWLAEKLDLDFHLNAEKVISGQFVATGVNSDVSIGHDFIKITNANMNTCGGSMAMNAEITGTSSTHHSLSTNVAVTNVRINDLFYSFNDFSQKSITHENLFGTVNAAAFITAGLNDKYGIVGSTLNGKLNTSIKNGKLKDIETLEAITKYIFKNRDFSDIQFSNIYNKAKIRGGLIDVDTLNIFSSVITLFIKGVYDLNNKNSDLFITVPLSNLKKMDDKERMQQSDSAARKGGNILFRATNAKDGGIIIAPVIFGKKKKLAGK